MFGDKKNPDDLINEKMEPIIIKQESKDDKKFIYIVIILLILLFIMALGVIAFLGSKYFEESSTSTKKHTKYIEPASKEKPVIKKDTLKPIKSVEAKENTKALEELISTNTQQTSTKNSTINSAISKVTTKSNSKELSNEELATLAKLVAKELSKANNTSSTKINTQESDKKLVQSLEAAPIDTLNEQTIDTDKLKNNTNKITNSTKRIDTFNKVIVSQKKDSNDEFAKLTNEIDTILKSDDVKRVESNNKYNSVIDKETTQRENELRFIVVKEGDTLSSIARRAYGRASAYRKIYEANPTLIKNPHKIHIGMKLRVPLN